MVKAVLPPQRALILVGELRSYKPHSTARKKVKFNLKLKKKKYIYMLFFKSPHVSQPEAYLRDLD